ncbi:hypothetical protein [Aminipila terrae]|uniref:Uncharacterized protein n=1 Tax=Aminipila terrae TaxID=2697030 RepID=A0A6P1MFF8_9FIRM|nr:hypothetical protein [Aminipila terrae]QHI72481.1 hypothetical protein Ami3637_08815 [Aminipila terrae]
MNLKKIFTYLTVGLLLSSTNYILNENNMVYASSSELNAPTENSKIIYRAAETEWRFRTVNGKGQKRLWSITYNKWLTNWKWV